MRFLRLDDAPLAIKIGLAPLIGFLALALVAGGSAWMNFNQRAVLENVVKRDVPASLRLAQISQRIRSSNGELYLLLTRQAAGIETASVPGRAAELGKEIKAIQVEVDQVIAAASTDAERAPLKALRKELTGYNDAVGVVVSMLEVDFSTAAQFSVPFEQAYRSMNSVLDKAVETSRTSSLARAEASVAQAKLIGAVATVLVILALALGVLIAGLYAGANEGLEHHLFKGEKLHSFWNARAAAATGRARDPRVEPLRVFMHVPRTTGSAMTTHLLAPIPNEASPIWPHEYYDQAIANNGTFLQEANRVGRFNDSGNMRAQVTVKGFFNRRDFLAIEEVAAGAGELAPRAFTIRRHPVERLLSLLVWGAWHKVDAHDHVRLPYYNSVDGNQPTN